MNNVLQMKEKKTFTTTISHSPFAMCVEKTQRRPNRHIRKLCLISSLVQQSPLSLENSLSLSINYVKDHTATQQYPEFDYISVQYKYNSCNLKQAP